MKRDIDIILKKINDSCENPELQDLVDLIEHVRYYAQKRDFSFILNFIDVLVDNERLRRNFNIFLSNIISGKQQVRIFTELGVSMKRSFSEELSRRVYEKILPQVVKEEDLQSVISNVFSDKDDYLWIRNIPKDYWERFFALIDLGNYQNKFLPNAFNPSFLVAIQIVSSRITSLGLEPELLDRLPSSDEYSECFQVLAYEANLLINVIKDEKSSRSDVHSRYLHLKTIISKCNNTITWLEGNQKERGVSVDFSYLLTRIRQNLNCLNSLLAAVSEKNLKDRITSVVEIFIQMVTVENQKHGVRYLLSENTSMLAYQVVEHTKQTGEHYITKTKKEYFSFLKKSMMGGFIISFTTWMKFILGSIHSAPLATGLLYGLNYSLSFILIFFTHATLATKQPAMTASVLASSLKKINVNNTDNINSTINTIVQLSRSQFVSFAGNLMVVIPLPFLIAWAYHYFTGDLIVSHHKAVATIESIDFVKSDSLFFASITGVLLFLSGVVNGYYDNWVNYNQIGERIKVNKKLKKWFSESFVNKLGGYVDRNYGAIMSNIFLGMSLGLASVIGDITGLPIDIRHVTLAGGSFAMAYYSIGDYMNGWQIFSALMGVAGIGIMNFLVSFGLSLYLAMRSRNIGFGLFINIASTIIGYISSRPQDFFYPPSVNNNKTNNE